MSVNADATPDLVRIGAPKKSVLIANHRDNASCRTGSQEQFSSQGSGFHDERNSPRGLAPQKRNHLKFFPGYSDDIPVERQVAGRQKVSAGERVSP